MWNWRSRSSITQILPCSKDCHAMWHTADLAILGPSIELTPQPRGSRSESQSSLIDQNRTWLEKQPGAAERGHSTDLSRREKMESENAADETTSSAVSGLLPLASASQQPYVSELLSFTLDRLHKVLSFFLPSSLCEPQKILSECIIKFLTLSKGTGASSGWCGADPEANARGGGGKLPSIHCRSRFVACHSGGSFCHR